VVAALFLEDAKVKLFEFGATAWGADYLWFLGAVIFVASALFGRLYYATDVDMLSS